MNPTQAAQALRARVKDLTRPEDEKDLLHYAAMCVEAYEIWQQKTDWVQDQVSTFPLQALGKHRADVLREEIERLRRIEALMQRYMARVIDIESVPFIDEGLSYGRIDFEGEDLATLKAIEQQVRQQFNL